MTKIACISILVETSPQALPLGAACIASSINSSSLLKELAFADLLSYSIEDNLNPQVIAEHIIHENYSICCFSVFVWNRILFTQIAQILKQNNSSLVIIVGGPEVTSNPNSFDNYDFIVSGEGEKIVPSIIYNFLNNQISEKFSLANLSAEEVFNLNSPYLDKTITLKTEGGVLWELARGCPFKCSYCYESKGSKVIKKFSLERIENELQLFRDKKISQIFVLDPTYNADKKRALQILSLCKKYLPDTYFYFECRAEFLDKELINAFSKINCSIQIGLQSSDEIVLSKANRTFNKKEFIQKINLLNNKNIIFGFDIIFGLPEDTLQKFYESINFAINLYPNHLELFKLSVLPGTLLFEQAINEKLIFLHEPPYHIISSPTFPKESIELANQVSIACNLFYSLGRAVPWFITLLKPLKMKPSDFFIEFSKFLLSKKIISDKNLLKSNHKEIEKLQIEFITQQYTSKHLLRILQLAIQIIQINGAFSRASGENETTKLITTYHPEDLLSSYATNLFLFVDNIKPSKYSFLIAPSKEGPFIKF